MIPLLQMLQGLGQQNAGQSSPQIAGLSGLNQSPSRVGILGDLSGAANAKMSDEDRTWSNFMPAASKATAGTSRMPWVFNGFGDLPENPNDIMSWFFKQQQGQQAPPADPMTQQVMPQPQPPGQGQPQGAPQQYGFGNNQAPPSGVAGAQQTAGGAMLFGQDGRPMYMIGEGGGLRPLTKEEQDAHWMKQLQQMIGGSLGGDVGGGLEGWSGSEGEGGWGSGDMGGGDGKDSGGGGSEWGSGGGGASP